MTVLQTRAPSARNSMYVCFSDFMTGVKRTVSGKAMAAKFVPWTSQISQWLLKSLSGKSARASEQLWRTSRSIHAVIGVSSSKLVPSKDFNLSNNTVERVDSGMSQPPNICRCDFLFEANKCDHVPVQVYIFAFISCQFQGFEVPFHNFSTTNIYFFIFSAIN